LHAFDRRYISQSHPGEHGKVEPADRMCRMPQRICSCIAEVDSVGKSTNPHTVQYNCNTLPFHELSDLLLLLDEYGKRAFNRSDCS
jgi:hypothetical protein